MFSKKKNVLNLLWLLYPKVVYFCFIFKFHIIFSAKIQICLTHETSSLAKSNVKKWNYAFMFKKPFPSVDFFYIEPKIASLIQLPATYHYCMSLKMRLATILGKISRNSESILVYFKLNSLIIGSRKVLSFINNNGAACIVKNL